jgi:hypothetical protein
MRHGQVGVLWGKVAIGAEGQDAHHAVGALSGDQQAVGFVPGLGLLWVRKPQQTCTPAL